MSYSVYLRNEDGELEYAVTWDSLADALADAKEYSENPALYHSDEVTITNDSNGLAVWRSTDPPELKHYVELNHEQWQGLEQGGHKTIDTPSVYFDLDGTLGKWYADGRGMSLEEMIDPANHYFRNIEPIDTMVSLARQLHEQGVDVCIMGAAYKDTIRDKWEWIHEHLPFIPDENICLAPIGADKTNFVKGNAEISILIDDYNKNLEQWKGTAFKAMNGINSHQEQFPEIDMTSAQQVQNKIQNMDVHHPLYTGFQQMIAQKITDVAQNITDTITHIEDRQLDALKAKYELFLMDDMCRELGFHDATKSMVETIQIDDTMLYTPIASTSELQVYRAFDSLMQAKELDRKEEKTMEQQELATLREKYQDGLPDICEVLSKQAETRNLVSWAGDYALYEPAVGVTELQIYQAFDKFMELQKPFEQDYQLLSRLQQDCKYYLNAGNRNDKDLWAKNPIDQIAKMQELYDKVPVKPEWITQSDIHRYAQDMDVPARQAYEGYKRQWVREHIDDVTMTQTQALYENTDEAVNMTFNQYVQEYGFADGSCYASFQEFRDNEYVAIELANRIEEFMYERGEYDYAPSERPVWLQMEDASAYELYNSNSDVGVDRDTAATQIHLALTEGNFGGADRLIQYLETESMVMDEADELAQVAEQLAQEVKEQAYGSVEEYDRQQGLRRLAKEVISYTEDTNALKNPSDEVLYLLCGDDKLMAENLITNALVQGGDDMKVLHDYIKHELESAQSAYEACNHSGNPIQEEETEYYAKRIERLESMAERIQSAEDHMNFNMFEDKNGIDHTDDYHTLLENFEKLSGSETAYHDMAVAIMDGNTERIQQLMDEVEVPDDVKEELLNTANDIGKIVHATDAVEKFCKDYAKYNAPKEAEAQAKKQNKTDIDLD